MVRMVCEMCNGHEFIKEDNFYVCQFCGVKYAPEAAKKLFVEGTVRVDRTEEKENSLANARRAMQLEDWVGAEKFYHMVTERDHENYEAVFYHAYAQVKLALATPELFQRQAAFKILYNAIDLLVTIFSVDKESEHKPILLQIGKDIMAMANSDFVYNSTIIWNGFKAVTEDDRNATILLYNELCQRYAQALEAIAGKYSEQNARKRIDYYQMALAQLNFILNGNCRINSWDVRKSQKRIQDIISQIEDPEGYVRREAEKQAKENETRRKRAKMAVPALCLAICAFLFNFVPIANYFVPLIAGIPGLILAIKGIRGRKAIALPGVIIGGGAILWWYIYMFVQLLSWLIY